MATSSIIKEFYVKDNVAFEQLKKDLDSEYLINRKQITVPNCLCKGKEELNEFVFKVDID